MTQKVNPYDHLNGFYRPGLCLQEQLLETTVGRDENLNELLEKLKSQHFSDERDNFIVMGSPGVGKTHFIRILGKTIQNSPTHSHLYVVIQFPEENHRILTFADLLLGIVEILSNISDDAEWKELYSLLEDTGDDNLIINEIIPRLERFCLTNKKSLLILFENLDVFFKEQLKDQKNVRKLKKFLTESLFITLIGTSQYNSSKTEELKKSPYNLFDIQILDVLDEEQSIDLIYKKLKWDRRDELLQQFDDLVPRIKALHEMSGGNPRLSLIFYELIAKENKWDVKKQIEKLLDQTSPFFRNRMRTLTPQERAILETIALMGLEYKTSNSISKKMRISTQQTTSLLNRLLKIGYLKVTDHPKDKRLRIYRIREGFLGLWLAIGHSRQQNTVLPRLVEFLEQWYAEKQGRERKREQLWNFLNSANAPELHYEIKSQELLLNYLSDIGSDEEIIQNKIELIYYYLLNQKHNEGKTLLREIQSLAPMRPYYQWMARQFVKWISMDIDSETSRQMEEMINCWRLQKHDDQEKLAKQAIVLSNSLINNSLFHLNNSFLRDQLAYLSATSLKILLLERVATGFEKQLLWEDALDTWNEISAIAKQSGDIKAQGTTLNNISQIYQDLGDYQTALDYLRQSLKILNDINDYDGQGTILNNIATIHFEQGYYEKALERLVQALNVTKKNHNTRIEAITLSNISLIYQARGDYDKALEYLTNSLFCMKRAGDKLGESTTLHNISQIYLELGAFEEALKYIDEALVMRKEIDAKDGVCFSLLIKGKILWTSGLEEKGLYNCLLSYQMANDLRLSDALNQLERFSTSIGENGLELWEKLCGEIPEDSRYQYNH